MSTNMRMSTKPIMIIIKITPPKRQDGHHDEGEDHHGHSHAPGSPDPHVWVSPLAMRSHGLDRRRRTERTAPRLRGRFPPPTTPRPWRNHQCRRRRRRKRTRRRCRSALSWYSTRRGAISQTPTACARWRSRRAARSRARRTCIRIVDEAKEHAIKVIFVQAQFSQRAAKAIAEDIRRRRSSRSIRWPTTGRRTRGLSAPLSPPPCANRNGSRHRESGHRLRGRQFPL